MAAYLVPLLISMLVCFGLQAAALHSVGGRTLKSESNFHSSVARIQTGTKGKPRIMLLGSSLTGRFPDEVSGFPGVANLGCDGGSALATLRAMDRGSLPTAPLLILEGNTLYRASAGSESSVGNAIESPWFKVGLKVPVLGSTARPAAFSYSLLRSRRVSGEVVNDGKTLPVASSPEVPASEPALTTEEIALLSELVEILERMREKGVSILVAIYPPGAEQDSPNIRIPTALAYRANLPFWDLTEGLPPTAVRYTDGVHMAPESAAITLQTMLRWMETSQLSEEP